jgi:hypothetical protein
MCHLSLSPFFCNHIEGHSAKSPLQEAKGLLVWNRKGPSLLLLRTMHSNPPPSASKGSPTACGTAEGQAILCRAPSQRQQTFLLLWNSYAAICWVSCDHPAVPHRITAHQRVDAPALGQEPTPMITDDRLIQTIQ